MSDDKYDQQARELVKKVTDIEYLRTIPNVAFKSNVYDIAAALRAAYKDGRGDFETVVADLCLLKDMVLSGRFEEARSMVEWSTKSHEEWLGHPTLKAATLKAIKDLDA